MQILIKEQPIPIYETTFPVCGVSNWASLTPINDDMGRERKEDTKTNTVINTGDAMSTRTYIREEWIGE